jgi:cytosine/adenosine deaminase-related metal-dependent hydrolase
MDPQAGKRVRIDGGVHAHIHAREFSRSQQEFEETCMERAEKEGMWVWWRDQGDARR